MKKYIYTLIVLTFLTGCIDKLEPVPNNEIIKLDITKDSLLANGSSTSEITVQINEDAMDDFRTVTLEFSGGKVDGKSGQVEKQVDNDGLITFKYMAGTNAGSFNIKASITNGTDTFFATAVIKLYTSPTNEVITALVLADTLNVLADGQSYFKVNVTVNDYPGAKVKLTTTEGKFLENLKDSIELDQEEGMVSATIQTSQKAIPYVITAEVLGTNYSRNVIFTPGISYPEMIVTTPGAWTIDSMPNNTLTSTTYLSRTVGKISEGIEIYGESFQLSPDQVNNGAFNPFIVNTDSDGSSTFNFTNSPGLNRDLPLFFVFKIQGVNGTLTDTISIDVN